MTKYTVPTESVNTVFATFWQKQAIIPQWSSRPPKIIPLTLERLDALAAGNIFWRPNKQSGLAALNKLLTTTTGESYRQHGRKIIPRYPGSPRRRRNQSIYSVCQVAKAVLCATNLNPYAYKDLRPYQMDARTIAGEHDFTLTRHSGGLAETTVKDALAVLKSLGVLATRRNKNDDKTRERTATRFLADKANTLFNMLGLRSLWNKHRKDSADDQNKRTNNPPAPEGPRDFESALANMRKSLDTSRKKRPP